ncbi:MAG: hypothetical protein Q4C57_08350 [Bacillota bacterium]|nr:hypothetical protein [Bacillota bacterium]
MVEEVRVNQEMYNGSQEDHDALREAVKRLSSASEEQFETIKKEKWYNRVFDMVTFSQKGKKRIAEQVGTLAQAQQILIELLMRLSDNDSSVSKLVVESMEDIKRIQEQNIFLLSKIKKLENISLGIKTDMDLNKLSETNKKILCACLYYISNQDENTSDEQKTFANQVIKYLNVDTQMDNPIATLEDMDTESKKRILNCCMEYMFLKNCSNDGYETYEDFISEFDFGNKTIKAIEKQILSLYNLRGLDGFFTKYQVDNFETIDDFFTLDFEDGYGENGIDEEEHIEMTDEVISTITQIRAGETKIYKHKNIHLKAYINCEGNLIFDHCIINYNETDDGDEITLSKNASLTITNSVVICKGFDENAFITCEGDTQITLDRNSFEDCSYFIKSSFVCVFSMTNCRLHNCYEGFLSIYSGDKSDCVIRDNIIIQDGFNSFYTKNNRFRCPTLICVYSHGNIVEFYNNIILEEEGFRRDGVEEGKGGNRITYFSCDDGEVRNCSFKGISQSIVALKYAECKFEKCTEAIRPRKSYLSSSAPCIDNCVFVECTNVISTVENTQITNCQFVSCYNYIIMPLSFDGGVSVEFCQFINTKNTFKNSFSDCFCVTFRRAKESKTRANYLKKCIFDGVELGDNFLIGALGFEKPSGTVTYIEGCDFKNCSTKRTSGKIIKEYIKYDTLFKKNIDFHANQVSKCRGLDKVNKERTETETVEIRTVSTEGNVIGSALAMGVAGAIGGPVALAALSGVVITQGLIKKK